MTHIVAKRSTKEAAEREAVRIRKVIRSGTKITVKKQGYKQYGVYME